MRISFDDHPDLQSLTIRSSSLGSRICCFSPCIEQVQRTVQALQICSFIDVQTIECVNRPFEFRPLVYKSLNLDGVSVLVEMVIGCSSDDGISLNSLFRILFELREILRSSFESHNLAKIWPIKTMITKGLLLSL